MTDMKGYSKWIMPVLMALLPVCMTAQKYRINGYVLDDAGNMPDVNIKEVNGKWLGFTDLNGHFDMRTDADSVEFSFIGYQTVKMAAAQGRNVVIQLMPNATVEEVTVKAKYLSESIGKVPPVAKGNLMPYEIPVIIPKNIFKGNQRFVFQPVLTQVATGKKKVMKPMVVDGRKYNYTQQRMYDWDLEKDPLGRFVVVADESVTDSGRVYVIYRDTVFVDKPRDVYTLDIYKSYENYTKVLKMDSMPDYIRGAVNPLKFLNLTMNAAPVTDSMFFPRPNRQFMDTEGNINLKYVIGKSELNMDDEQNRKELEQLEKELKMLDGEEGVTLQTFAIRGVASPDGPYGTNRRLAQRRMKAALDYIVGRLSPQTRGLIELHSDAEVAPWDSIVPLMERDSLYELAEKVKTCIALGNGNMARTEKEIKKLKEYKTVIAAKYLPMMRTARYKYTYSIFRNRTVSEIQQLYNQGKVLSEFEYWKLYSDKKNPQEKERICRDALKRYPDFMMAANDLQVLLIGQGRPDDRLLERFMGKEGMPDEVKVNHVIALLHNQRYSDAYEVANGPMRKSERTVRIRAFVNAMNNVMTPEEVRLIENTGVMNRILMRLNEGDNKTALSLIMGMENLDAEGYYVKAVCYARNNLTTAAQDLLKKAIDMKPELENVAKGDADVFEVYKLLKEKKK